MVPLPMQFERFTYMYITFNGELYSCLCFRLSLDVTGFNQQATGAVLDLTADDDEGLGRNKGMKKW